MELSAKELEATVIELTHKLERLRASYDQYFMGISKREPSVQLKEVVRLVYLIDQQKIRNTRLRFRFRTTVQKLNTLRTQWKRTLREIENGTYFRDVAKVRRKMQQAGMSMPSRGSMRTAGDFERSVREAVSGENAQPTPAVTPAQAAREAAQQSMKESLAPPKPAVVRPEKRTVEASPHSDIDDAIDQIQLGGPSASPPAPKPAAPRPSVPKAPAAARPTVGRPPATRPTPARASAAPSGLASKEMDSLYRRFVKAKKMCGQDGSTVQYDALAKTVAQQLPRLKAAHPGKNVGFDVIIRGGKPMLKAKTK